MSTTLRRERIKKSERARDVSCKWANSQRIYEVVYIYIYIATTGGEVRTPA